MNVFKLESKTNPFKLPLTEFDDIYKEIAPVCFYSNYLTSNITKDNNTVSYNGKRFYYPAGNCIRRRNSPPNRRYFRHRETG